MAGVLAVRGGYRAQNWVMMIREFCRQRGISEKTYYYWLRKLRSLTTKAAAP